MKFCKIGIHKYKSIGTQMAKNVVGGFSGIQLQREMLKCNCGKIKYVGYDIATNVHLDDTLDWQPNIL